MLIAPQRWQGAPQDGVVAVKVQYPDALQTMLQDLSNIRVAAGFLQARDLHDLQKYYLPLNLASTLSHVHG